MSGFDAPDPSWIGGIPDVAYRVGPGFNEENRNKKVKLTVNNVFKIKKDYNVIGRMDGDVEPGKSHFSICRAYNRSHSNQLHSCIILYVMIF